MCTAPLRCGTKKRGKPVELRVEEHGWDPAVSAPAAEQMRWVRVAGGEVELRRQVKAAGGKWRPQPQVWELRYARIVALGLTGRLVAERESIYG